MELFILKTDIQNIREVEIVSLVLNYHPNIDRWSIDTEDVDNVLRVEGSAELIDVIRLVKNCGFECEELPD